MAKTVHQLKVTLRDVKPPVWRRIAVRSDMTLGELAAVVEAAMGWQGYHLHALNVGDARYGMPDPEWDVLDENRYRLGKVLPTVGSTMRWEYDFGDGWEHDVVVEEVGPPDPAVEYPVCLKGRRACPPEDCGGLRGYADLVEALADSSAPDHRGAREWAAGFDPAHFDLDETSAAMRSPRPLHEW